MIVASAITHTAGVVRQCWSVGAVKKLLLAKASSRWQIDVRVGEMEFALFSSMDFGGTSIRL
mgnify:CR=1 FL=1